MAIDTKDRLVATARELFWRKGYGSTSIADVLQAAGVNSGSLYHFFPGKQDLLVAVLDAYHQGIDELLLEPAWRGVDDPIERIFALLGVYRAAIVQTECTYGCPIGSLSLEIHEPDPIVRERLVANFSAWVGAIEACLDAAAPRFAPNLDRHAVAEFVLTTMEGAVMLTRTWRDVACFDRAIQQLRSYLETLLVVPVARARRSKVASRPRTSKRTKQRKR